MTDSPLGGADDPSAAQGRSDAGRVVTLPAVAQTAFWTAACRADESARASARIHDPWAAVLAGEEGLAVGRALERQGRAHEAIVARTCVVDELVAAAAREVDAIYSFGAGLCTRRLRLGIELPWTEVDLPALVAFKDVAAAGLPGADRVRRVGLDLRDTPAVARLLAERVEPRLLVVLEGVLVYLEEKEVLALLTVLGARVGSTRVVLDLGGGLWASLFARRTRTTVGAHGTPYRTSLRQGRRALARAGFEVIADRSLVDWDAATPAPRFYRPPSAWLVPGFADVARVLEARAPRPR